jgi:histone arginine demethylase JMJD6
VKASRPRVSIWSDFEPAVGSSKPAYRIERRSGLSAQEFTGDYVRENRPVVLTDAATNWPALSRWTPAFFKERFGAVDVNVEGQGRPLGAFVDEMKASRFDRPGRCASSMSIARQFPALIADIDPHPSCWGPDITGLEITMGGTGSAFPNNGCRQPPTDTFVAQIHGRSEWIVSRHARPIRFFVEPGEMVYIPPGWWHTTRALTPSIALVLTGARGPVWWGVTKSWFADTLRTFAGR